MKIERVRHNWPETAGFTISRPTGYPLYTFLHFQTPVTLEFEGKRTTAKPGACIFYAPGEPQFYCASGPLLHNWIHIDDTLGQWLSHYKLPVNTLFYPSETSFISELFQQIEAEHFGDHPYKEQLLQGYIHNFLILLSRSLHSCTSSPSTCQPEKLKMRALRNTILSHPEKRWTIPEMAAIAAMSESRFHTTYKAYFGTSPIHDLKEAKIRHAMMLLTTQQELSISEIAQKLGYENEYHFIRMFKSACGMPPGAYRKQSKK